MNNGNSCVNDLGCPGGTCDGQEVLANLVSASHSVNTNPEICDGQDNNGNGSIDEGFSVGETCLGTKRWT